MQFKDIPNEQVHLLASALHHHPSEQWPEYASRVYSLEHQLDRGLLRPDLLHRLIQRPQPNHAPLCDLHKMLNVKIIHQAFVLITSEVGLRLNSLVVAGRDKLGHETWDCSILNLRSLHGAWLLPEVFWDTFGKTLDVPQGGYTNEDYMAKWLLNEVKCEACILARIGGDLNTVLDLQMVVKSRTHTRSVRKYRGPKLNKLLEGWLKVWEMHHDPEQWRNKLEWNRLRGERLKNVRRQLGKERRRVRALRRTDDGQRSGKKKSKVNVSKTLIEHHHRSTGDESEPRTRVNCGYRQSGETVKFYLSPDASQADNNSSSEQPGDDEVDDDVEIRYTLYATENDIIDSYAALISTPFLPGMGLDEHNRRCSQLNTHRAAMLTQASEASWLMADDKAIDEQLSGSQSARSRQPSNYSESIYSQSRASSTLMPHTPAPHLSNFAVKFGRNMSLSDKRISNKSWLTASIAPSIANAQTNIAQNKAKRSDKRDRTFDAIAEETSSPQALYDSSRDRPISPLRDDELFAANPRPHSPENKFGHSLVSPKTPVYSAGRNSQQPYWPNQPDSRSNTARGNSEPGTDLPRKRYSATQSNYQRGPRLNSRLSRPFDGPAVSKGLKTSYRLSRPFDGPATRSETPETTTNRPDQQINFERLKFRDTFATQLTRWSDLYGDQAGRIKQLEDQLKNPLPGSTTKAMPKI